MTPSRTLRLLALALVFLATAGCDQTTKHFARTGFPRADVTGLSRGVVRFNLAENPGAFLSLGASLPEAARSGILTLGVVICLSLLFAHLLRAPRLRWICFIGLGLVWAGGMSNLIDRVYRHGLVTDFLVIQIGPLHTGIFNVADFAVMVGLFLFIASSMMEKPAPAQDATPAKTT